MTGLEWFFSVTFAVFYVCLIFTVALICFRKGHLVLGIVGIFVPFLWLLGAVLPARPDSNYVAV